MAKCSKHPKYNGLKKAKYQCYDCLLLFIQLRSKPRLKLPPNKVFRDKTKYNRKRQKGSNK